MGMSYLLANVTNGFAISGSKFREIIEVATDITLQSLRN